MSSPRVPWVIVGLPPHVPQPARRGSDSDRCVLPPRYSRPSKLRMEICDAMHNLKLMPNLLRDRVAVSVRRGVCVGAWSGRACPYITSTKL